MRLISKSLIAVLLFGITFVGHAWAQGCPARPNFGTNVMDPLTLHSQNGTLQVALTLSESTDKFGYVHYCYVYDNNGKMVEAPTLFLNPGDTLILDITNALSPDDPAEDPTPAIDRMDMTVRKPADLPVDDCNGGTVTEHTTNIHFHGVNFPPTCHQDDVIYTLIQPGDPPFEYKIQIPPNDPPGAYWYHPHPHGFATIQVNGRRFRRAYHWGIKWTEQRRRGVAGAATYHPPAVPHRPVRAVPNATDRQFSSVCTAKRSCSHHPNEAGTKAILARGECVLAGISGLPSLVRLNASSKLS